MVFDRVQFLSPADTESEVNLKPEMEALEMVNEVYIRELHNQVCRNHRHRQ